MGNFLYKDFYEGLLRLILLLAPIVVGWLSAFASGNIEAIPLSLILSIISLIYSKRNIYKDERYTYNRRIKIEMALSLSFLAISLLMALYQWRNITEKNTADDFTASIVLYFISVLPCVFETILVFLRKDLGLRLNFKKKESDVLDFDITVANIN